MHTTGRNPRSEQHKIPQTWVLRELLKFTVLWKDPARQLKVVEDAELSPDWLAKRQGCVLPVGGEQKAHPQTKEGQFSQLFRE